MQTPKELHWPNSLNWHTMSMHAIMAQPHPLSPYQQSKLHWPFRLSNLHSLSSVFIFFLLPSDTLNIISEIVLWKHWKYYLFFFIIQVIFLSQVSREIFVDIENSKILQQITTLLILVFVTLLLLFEISQTNRSKCNASTAY